MARISAELDATPQEEKDDATPTVVASIEENEIEVILNEVEGPLLLELSSPIVYRSNPYLGGVSHVLGL